MRLRNKIAFPLCLVALYGVCSAIAQEGAKPVYDVWLSSRFQYESDATGSDADIRPYVSLYGHGLLDGHLDLRLSGAFDWDTNGEDSIDHANERAWKRVHEAAVDFHDYGPLSHLVLGRQYFPRVDYLHFDGLSLSLWDHGEVGVFGFGGRPVSYYSSNDNEWLAGAGIQYRPLDSTEIQVDGYGIDDLEEEDFVTAVRVFQSFPSGFGDAVEARWIDGDFRDLELRLYYHGAEKHDWSAMVYWQADQVGDDFHRSQSRYFSAYSGFMGPLEEHVLLSLDVNRYLGEHVTLSAGGSYRDFMDRDKEGGENFTNVDSARITAGFSVSDLPTPGLNFGLYANHYRNPEESSWDLTGEIGYTFSPRLEASCGVTRIRYDFSDDYFFRDRFDRRVIDENGGTHTGSLLFFEVRYKPAARWRIVVRGEREDTDGLPEEHSYLLSLRIDYRFRTARSKAKKTAE